VHAGMAARGGRFCGSFYVPRMRIRIQVRINSGSVSCRRAYNVMRQAYLHPGRRIPGWRCTDPRSGQVSCHRLRASPPARQTPSRPSPAPRPTPPATPAPQPPLEIGFTDNAGTLQSRSLVSAHHPEARGAKWLRTGFNWNVIEPRRGQWDWSFYDWLVTTEALRGVKVIPVLLVTPSWAGINTGVMPDDPRDYADYVAHVVARYGRGGTFWRAHPTLDGRLAVTWFDIWNEPFLWDYSTNGVNAGRYARLLRAAVAAGRRANARAKFFLEADLSWSDAPGRPFHGDWVGAMYAAVPNLNAWFDAVSVHPYSQGQSPDATTGDPRWRFGRIADIRARFVARGAAAKPFWITELGWATGCAYAGCVSDVQQAFYVVRAMQLADALPYVRGFLLYTYQDTHPAITGDYFGLYRADGTARVAVRAFADAAAAARR